MGFQHLTPEERSRNASKAAKALWNVSSERKKELLENSFHSGKAKRHSLESLEERAKSLKRSWDRLSLEEREVRVNAADEGVGGKVKRLPKLEDSGAILGG